MTLAWSLLLLLALMSCSIATVEAFAFAPPTPGALAARALTGAVGTGAAARPRTYPTCASAAAAVSKVVGRRTRAASVRMAGKKDEKDDGAPIDVLTGSGLRGVDTSKLTGSDKRDADWFQRTAEREARGQLQWFEDPAVYLGLCLLVPVVISVWGVLNCYIPGFCSSNF